MAPVSANAAAQATFKLQRAVQLIYCRYINKQLYKDQLTIEERITLASKDIELPKEIRALFVSCAKWRRSYTTTAHMALMTVAIRQVRVHHEQMVDAYGEHDAISLMSDISEYILTDEQVDHILR